MHAEEGNKQRGQGDLLIITHFKLIEHKQTRISDLQAEIGFAHKTHNKDSPKKEDD